MELPHNFSKVLSRIHRHIYLYYFLLFVFFIALCAGGKLYSGTPGKFQILSLYYNSFLWVTIFCLLGVKGAPEVHFLNA